MRTTTKEVADAIKDFTEKVPTFDADGITSGMTTVMGIIAAWVPERMEDQDLLNELTDVAFAAISKRNAELMTSFLASSVPQKDSTVH